MYWHRNNTREHRHLCDRRPRNRRPRAAATTVTGSSAGHTCNCCREYRCLCGGRPRPVANAITGSSAGHKCTAPWALDATHEAGVRLTALVGEGAGATLPCNDLGRHHCKKRIVVLPEVSC